MKNPVVLPAFFPCNLITETVFQVVLAFEHSLGGRHTIRTPDLEGVPPRERVCLGTDLAVDETQVKEHITLVGGSGVLWE